ncbi:hypothetical protein ACFC5Z_38935 [Streptomyces sp. NPDC056004]|uniref:hypothetical protein n=1 Tax=Streptomyces sp. NPDC056004 TaxID=3345677 RepID=UPI0035D78C50
MQHRLRRAIATRMCPALDDMPGTYPPYVPASARPTWYALPLRYEPTELGGLPIRRFLEPYTPRVPWKRTCRDPPARLDTHPLFQRPGALLPG